MEHASFIHGLAGSMRNTGRRGCQTFGLLPVIPPHLPQNIPLWEACFKEGGRGFACPPHICIYFSACLAMLQLAGSALHGFPPLPQSLLPWPVPCACTRTAFAALPPLTHGRGTGALAGTWEKNTSHCFLCIISPMREEQLTQTPRQFAGSSGGVALACFAAFSSGSGRRHATSPPWGQAFGGKSLTFLSLSRHHIRHPLGEARRRKRKENEKKGKGKHTYSGVEGLPFLCLLS